MAAFSAARVEVLVWVLVYGGLIAAAIGCSLLQGGTGWGLAVVGGGLAVAAAGFFLIWFRSRMKPDAGARD